MQRKFHKLVVEAIVETRVNVSQTRKSTIEETRKSVIEETSENIMAS
jgi:hypothetical protein